MAETIEQTLRVVIEDVEESYPGSLVEYRRQQILVGLEGFIYRFIDNCELSAAEDRLIQFTIAMRLLDRFRDEVITNVLRESLSRRGFYSQGEKGEKTDA